MQSIMNEESSSESTTIQMAEQLFIKLKLNDEEKVYEIHALEENESDEDEDQDEDGEEDFSFSSAFDELINQSQITAEDAFSNGQIKPVFPLFNQGLLLEQGLNLEELISNGDLPNVKKVFVPATESTSGNGDISGSYCEWDKIAVETTTCKKSNSTGFSKIWRFKDFMHRSSSDGKDAFVFLNDTSPAVSKKREDKKKEAWESKVNGNEGEVKFTGVSKAKVKGKKVVKSKKELSAHEVYLKSKAKAEQQRRSHHTYRPEVVGLFTNITGGVLTRNVHPF